MAWKLFVRIAEGNSINPILTDFLFFVICDGKHYINIFNGMLLAPFVTFIS